MALPSFFGLMPHPSKTTRITGCVFKVFLFAGTRAHGVRAGRANSLNCTKFQEN